MAAVATSAERQPIYRPRGPDPLRTLFRRRFPDFQAAYEQRYAAKYGRFRLPLITRAASAFRVCGDWSQGIARIRCPSCGFDRFRPFSCKSYLLCPSCAQKRTLLVGEYLSVEFRLPRGEPQRLRRGKRCAQALGRKADGLVKPHRRHRAAHARPGPGSAVGKGLGERRAEPSAPDCAVTGDAASLTAALGASWFRCTWARDCPIAMTDSLQISLEVPARHSISVISISVDPLVGTTCVRPSTSNYPVVAAALA